MADPSAATNNNPSNRPQYFCHICQREIEPLMVPNPTCPICTNDFVEEIDTANDPREFAGVMGTDHELDLDHDADDEFDDMNMPSGGAPGSPDVAHMLQSLLQQVFGPNFRVETRTIPPGQGADGSAATTTTTTATITTGGATVTTGTYTGGPSQTGDGNNEQQQGQQGRPNVFVSMGGANNAAEGENIGSPTTPLLTITQILQRAFGDNTQGNNTTANLMNLFQMVGDPRDYAWGPGGLDQIITQLLEQQAARTAPPPAPEDIINNLPRTKITKKQVVEEQLNCPVCKEDYNEGEEVVSLPCNHAFHDECIKPWLKMNGTCPVCRYSLVKQEAEGSDQQNDDGSQNGHNTNANANSNLPSSSSGGTGWFLPGSYPTQQQDGRRNDNNANQDILEPESMD